MGRRESAATWARPGSAAWAVSWGRRLRLLLLLLHVDVQLVVNVERPRVGGMSVNPRGRRKTTDDDDG